MSFLTQTRLEQRKPQVPRAVHHLHPPELLHRACLMTRKRGYMSLRHVTVLKRQLQFGEDLSSLIPFPNFLFQQIDTPGYFCHHTQFPQDTNLIRIEKALKKLRVRFTERSRKKKCEIYNTVSSYISPHYLFYFEVFFPVIGFFFRS